MRLNWLLCLILMIHMGCSFIMTAAGSLVGNIGADLVGEHLKDKKDADGNQKRQ
jgi:hypothetical protein